ncbi:hypothetical protein shim_13180 [Shimia sp. SK013]|uniref:hypothetical protein n=1 Tax=Shimia sp. SK013 TaxID=1389006 RepID=UPI0006B673CE|nr:hypothetical protein [Shimia sp. SK013]KPA23025.1 hypothetical protein shim_13180 [Shimia sp. SK013]
MNDPRLTYPDGLKAMMDRYEGRRDPFDFGPETLPPITTDLDALCVKTVTPADTSRQPGEPNTSWSRKRWQIAEEFVGNSHLAFLNAQLISNLRKRTQPDQTAALFVRIWTEQSEHLIDALNLRWKVSSVQTFADHGTTAIQREVGQALRMLFGVMKLYEFERSFSGLSPDQAHNLGKRNKSRLPLDMEPMSLATGGLDINLLAPVWDLALQDPAIAPLAAHLMDTLNAEDTGVFRRLEKMRQKRLRRMAAK